MSVHYGLAAGDQLPFELRQRAIALLPHADNLRTVTNVLAFGEQSIVCLAHTPEAWRDCSVGSRLSTLHLVEVVAQVAAVGRVLEYAMEGDLQQRRGAVVRIRQFCVGPEQISLDEELHISARWSSSVAGAFEVFGIASVAGEEVARGRLTMVEL